MLSELDVLKLISERLSNNRFSFMLPGSFALDLILSKLVWAAETNSEMQLRDVKSLVHASPGASLGISDTPTKFSALVSERYAQMSADERMQIASDMFDTARKIIEASLPANLSRRARRLAVARRRYNDELPAAALDAHAGWESTQ
jgi:hypothetical protein